MTETRMVEVLSGPWAGKTGAVVGTRGGGIILVRIDGMNACISPYDTVRDIEDEPVPAPQPEITSGLGIGGIGSDDYNIHTEIDAGGPEYAREAHAEGDVVTPAGTTDGRRGGPSDRCAICGKPADWNPGAGRLLCHRHWDSY